MEWDLADWKDEPETGAENRKEFDLVPEGDRVLEIRQASQGAHRFKKGAASYLMLQLAATEGKHQFIFWDIPHNKNGTRGARQLAEALCLPIGEKLAINPDDVIGRRFLAEVYHTVSQTNGKTYANIRRVRKDETDTRPAWERDGVGNGGGVEDDIPF